MVRGPRKVRTTELDEWEDKIQMLRGAGDNEAAGWSGRATKNASYKDDKETNHTNATQALRFPSGNKH